MRLKRIVWGAEKGFLECLLELWDKVYCKLLVKQRLGLAQKVHYVKKM
jgi:hypothetical protein